MASLALQSLTATGMFGNISYFQTAALNSRDADDAEHEQHGRSLLGSRIVVEHAKGPRGPDSSGRYFMRDKLTTHVLSLTGVHPG